MPGRMQRHLDVADPEHLAIRQCLLFPPGLVAEPMVHDRQRLGGRQDRPMAPAGVIAMALGYDVPFVLSPPLPIAAPVPLFHPFLPYLLPSLRVFRFHFPFLFSSPVFVLPPSLFPLFFL